MSRVQQYWLPGYGLSRHIVLGHIHYFLGPSASVRPYSYQVYRAIQPTLHHDFLAFSKGREGYLIVGVPLTRVCSLPRKRREEGRVADIYCQEQIDDLAAMSREYEKQEALRMTNQSSTGNGNGNSGDGPSRQPSEPYINELIPVDPSRARRRVEPDTRGSR
ncbi:uncharacterized protein N7459_004268 [Penicillium hispanicum]|uniref:uncharacterized protein n=1 Tax=Penicillium hispanicum TaxID=1080232 RepID=UPI002541AB6D|nr:uncharacterized protein N7459_004268 [Penicillium hispanicum]KAJ5584468.1 hypothetical protein N7459_004268 [Penicillium hispanicum]